MDSGNSGGSLQSSSGGDDEFDSRAGGVDSSPLSALLRPSPSAATAAFSLHGSLYGFQELSSGGTSVLSQQQQQVGTWSAGQFAAGAPSSSSPRVAHGDAGAGVNQQADPSAATQGPSAPPRGSRKRTRASRRAPTTVLNTDTSNFRAMVQEFTGIPSPPFVAGGVALRSRFDNLFPSPSPLRGAAADPASSLPSYLLRPFPQKLPTAPPPFPPFTSSSSSTPSSSNIGVDNANATTTGKAASTTATSLNPAAARAGDAFPLTMPSALLRMQDTNSYLSFHNILGSQSEPSSQQPMFGGFAQGPRLHETSPSPSLSEFLGGVSSGGISLTDGGLISSDSLHLHPRSDAHHGGDELSGVVASGSGGYGSCKLNYSSHAVASSSPAAASADKPPDTAAARSARGGGLDPWICTSE